MKINQKINSTTKDKQLYKLSYQQNQTHNKVQRLSFRGPKKDVDDIQFIPRLVKPEQPSILTDIVIKVRLVKYLTRDYEKTEPREICGS